MERLLRSYVVKNDNVLQRIVTSLSLLIHDVIIFHFSGVGSKH